MAGFGFIFGSRRTQRTRIDDMVGAVRPDLSRESLGVGPEFPGIAPNPVLSRAAHKRNAELRVGELAIGTLVDWREISADNGVRLALMLDVATPDGHSFRGIADEGFTVTELTRLAAGQVFPVRYRPEQLDHYVALARDLDPAAARELIDRIGHAQNN